MKSISTMTAIALLATIGGVHAQAVAPKRDICAVNQTANAAVIARAQAAATPAERKAILKAAIDANPANAVCIADLALQLSLASNVNPAAGPEEFGTTAEVPTTTDGTTPPAENASQLNQGTGTTPASPATPQL